MQAHAGSPNITDTFAYFIKHPVAPLNRRRLRAILQLIEAARTPGDTPLRILDIACGGGIISCAAASLGHQVLGIDINAHELKLARAFAVQLNLRAHFEQIDVISSHDLAERVAGKLGGAPDIVILAYALHHLNPVEPFLKGISQWLPSDTRLLINEENPYSPLFRAKHLLRTVIQQDTAGEQHRSYGAWKRLLESNGWQVTAPTGLDILPLIGRLTPRFSWSLLFQALRS